MQQLPINCCHIFSHLSLNLPMGSMSFFQSSSDIFTTHRFQAYETNFRPRKSQKERGHLWVCCVRSPYIKMGMTLDLMPSIYVGRGEGWESWWCWFFEWDCFCFWGSGHKPWREWMRSLSSKKQMSMMMMSHKNASYNISTLSPLYTPKCNARVVRY